MDTRTHSRTHTCTLCCDTAHSCIACRIKAIRTSHCILSLSSLSHTHSLEVARARKHAQNALRHALKHGLFIKLHYQICQALNLGDRQGRVADWKRTREEEPESPHTGTQKYIFLTCKFALPMWSNCPERNQPKSQIMEVDLKRSWLLRKINPASPQLARAARTGMPKFTLCLSYDSYSK